MAGPAESPALTLTQSLELPLRTGNRVLISITFGESVHSFSRRAAISILLTLFFSLWRIATNKNFVLDFF
jgi:hypothetical protein